jgi:hypothetical protein
MPEPTTIPHAPTYTNLPVVLYGCETWSQILWEQNRLGVFENMVMRRIFGPKRVVITGYWRELRNEELHNLYWPNIIRVIKCRRMRWKGYVVHEREREREGCMQNFGRKRPLGRPQCGWRITLLWMLEKQYVDTDWIHLAH